MTRPLTSISARSHRPAPDLAPRHDVRMRGAGPAPCAESPGWMLQAAAGGPARSIASAAALSTRQGHNSQAGATIFSDDHAPIEEMTRRMLRSHSL